MTADVGGLRPRRLIEILGLDPKALIDKARGEIKSSTDSLADMATALEEQGLSPSYIEVVLKALKSWLRYNNVKLIQRTTIIHGRRYPYPRGRADP